VPGRDEMYKGLRGVGMGKGDTGEERRTGMENAEMVNESPASDSHFSDRIKARSARRALSLRMRRTRSAFDRGMIGG